MRFSAPTGLRPEATRLAEALTALAAAAVTLRARVAPGVPAWTLIGQITHGRLLVPHLPRRVLARPQPAATVTTPNPPSHARTAAP